MPGRREHPGKVSGAWVFKGTRLPVATVIENLEDLSIDEVIEQFDVTREQVTAGLDFVAQSLRAERPRRCSSSLTTARRRDLPARCQRTPSIRRNQRVGRLSNGALLDAAEEVGFELLLTNDRRIRHQQDLRARRIALVG